MRIVFTVLLLTISFSVGSQQDPVKVLYTKSDETFVNILKAASKSLSAPLEVQFIDHDALKVGLLTGNDTINQSDIIITNSDLTGLQKLTRWSIIPEDMLSSAIDPRSLSPARIDNALYGIPIIQGHHLLLFYNRSMLKQAPTNWEQIVQAFEASNRKEPFIVYNFREMYWLIPFINAFGEEPIKNDWPNLDTNGMQLAITFIWSMVNRGIIDNDCFYECAMTKFTQGKSPLMINGSWSFDELKNSMGDKLGVAALPSINDNPMVSYRNSLVMGFPNDSLNSPKRKALLELVHYFHSKTTQEELWKVAKEIPVHSDVLEQVSRSEDKQFSLIVDLMPKAKPLPNHFNMTVIWEVIKIGFFKYGEGQSDAKTISDNMQKEALKTINPLSISDEQSASILFKEKR